MTGFAKLKITVLEASVKVGAVGKQRWMGAAPAGGMAGAVLQWFDPRSRERSLRRDAVTLPDCTHTPFASSTFL